MTDSTLKSDRIQRFTGALKAGEPNAARSWIKPDSKKNFLIGVNVTSRQLNALESYRNTLEEDVSRPHVVRMIISEWLKDRGYM